MRKKVISLLLTSTMIAAAVCGCGGETETVPENEALTESSSDESDMTEEMTKGMTGSIASYMESVKHEIAAGESKSVNPLKGLIPFQGDSCDFPHSMEWFYIPVNAVQVDMDEFDWTALEENLDAAAERGHQAAFRFFYDYPNKENGVPQFLIDGGLEMRPYDEPDTIGGSGSCPDYSDENFRQSMQNFIAALGAKYDGDPRIGFITEGLLGFWGEWHNWPFDADVSDGKPDWSIPEEVYTEVLTAFDDAFDITPLCVREPKGGVDNDSFDVGYHDDSFGYETLSVEAGGQSWSYGQKLANFGQTDRWMTACIGGEIYPQTQGIIFKDNPEYPDWMGELGRQEWDDCVVEVHPTWLMCDRIKSYQGEERKNAESASRQLGYDFQVTHAYFYETIDESPLEIDVDIRNIGVAPFYYDHTTWPVMVGVKQGDNLVARWETEWDLSSIPADGREVFFTHIVENHGLGGGEYTLCMKVKNPLEGGRLLGFANEGQADDGWLELGSITVNAPEKEMDIIEEIPPIDNVEFDSSVDSADSVDGGDSVDGVDGIYQAENGRIEGSAMVDSSLSKCSGGRKVGYIGKDGGSLYMENIEVSEDGTYSLDIVYITGEDRNVSLAVNDEEGIELALESTGSDWSTLGTYTTTVELKAGKNTLHFYNNDGWAPDIDCVKVYK